MATSTRTLDVGMPNLVPDSNFDTTVSAADAAGADKGGSAASDAELRRIALPSFRRAAERQTPLLQAWERALDRPAVMALSRTLEHAQSDLLEHQAGLRFPLIPRMVCVRTYSVKVTGLPDLRRWDRSSCLTHKQ
jgi:hypothetical protein